MKINNRKHKQDYQYSISLKMHILVDIRVICRSSYLSTQNGIFYDERYSARNVAFDMPTNVGPSYGMYVGRTSYQRYLSNISYVGATNMLVLRSLSTLGQWRDQPQYSVGPTLSCYLGMSFVYDNCACVTRFSLTKDIHALDIK